MIERNYNCCILGAGPAGIGTALELVNNGCSDLIVIERNNKVGGLARTESYDGYRFDIGPHRFFSKNDEINKLWNDTLGNDFIKVNRYTRIYYKEKLFHYPIEPLDVILKLGIIESVHAISSYFYSKTKSGYKEDTFENWIKNKFGTKLYETFFKTYTEKVWGIPCSNIGSEFAKQRIKGLSIIELIKSTYTKNNIKSLIDQFYYPILGAGQMYEVMAEKIVKSGGNILLDNKVIKINCNNNNIESIILENSSGIQTRVVARQFFSSLPITHFFHFMNPKESDDIIQASKDLYYRDHITVNLIIDNDQIFPDQWLYIHDPSVLLARIANYNNFSTHMSKKGKSCLSIEYFTFQHEKLWKMNDGALIDLAIEELDYLGLVNKNACEQGWVIRETESYPTYYLGYLKPFNILKTRLNELTNLMPIGRGGLYKYNNQDPSTYSGIIAARNYLNSGNKYYNLWNINIDAEYHEEIITK